MSKAKARVFVPLTKVDEEQRLVYGRITQEMLDKSGEVMDYTTSKPLFEKWSADIHEASGGLSKGNVRVMHGLTAAGKLTELDFDDLDKSIDVCAKIVDDAEWNKVTEGVYTGFSVGGSYAKRWTETIDGEKVKKFTAQPNEVSIVDNPCVPSACFSMFKADGSEEQIAFKVENDDEAWPDFAKADQRDTGDEDPENGTPTHEAGGETPDPKPADPPAEQEPVPAAEKVAKAIPAATEPSAEAVATRAGELAKAADNGTTWQDHIESARADLMKGDSALSLALEEERRAKDGGITDGNATPEAEVPPSEGADDAPADDDAEGGSSEKVTPAGVKQAWVASDGTSFDKKADAVSHEETLVKTETPLTEAEQLAARLAKALNPEVEQDEPPLIEDFDRLGKAVAVLETVVTDGFQPDALKKGMYTVSRFANVLADLGSLSRSIAREGKTADDAGEEGVSDAMKTAVAALGESFKTYAAQQITDLLAGIDDAVIVETYDYYYNAATVDPENGLAKDVSSLITQYREPATEQRDVLSKRFGIIEGTVEVTDELSPPMQKRFDELTTQNDELKKVATDAVEKVEELTKRVQTIEDTPQPRAPRNIALRDGDGTFLGKTANTAEEKLSVLHDLLKTKGPDALALDLIKLSQTNPHHLQLKG